MPLLDKEKTFRAPKEPPKEFACSECGGSDWKILTNHEVCCANCYEYTHINNLFKALTH